MKLEIDLWNLPTMQDWQADISLQLRLELDATVHPFEVKIVGPSEALNLIERFLNGLRESNVAKRYIKNFQELGHFLEDFKCPRCAMAGLEKLTQNENPNQAQAAP